MRTSHHPRVPPSVPSDFGKIIDRLSTETVSNLIKIVIASAAIVGQFLPTAALQKTYGSYRASTGRRRTRTFTGDSIGATAIRIPMSLRSDMRVSSSGLPRAESVR